MSFIDAVAEPSSWGTFIFRFALRSHLGSAKYTLYWLQAVTGTMTVSEREETTTGNQQLLYLIVDSIIIVH